MVYRVSSEYSARLIVVFIVLLFLGSMVLPVVGTVGENQLSLDNERSVRAGFTVKGNEIKELPNQNYDWASEKKFVHYTIHQRHFGYLGASVPLTLFDTASLYTLAKLLPCWGILAFRFARCFSLRACLVSLASWFLFRNCSSTT